MQSCHLQGVGGRNKHKNIIHYRMLRNSFSVSVCLAATPPPFFGLHWSPGSQFPEQVSNPHHLQRMQIVLTTIEFSTLEFFMLLIQTQSKCIKIDSSNLILYSHRNHQYYKEKKQFSVFCVSYFVPWEKRSKENKLPFKEASNQGEHL